MLLARVRFGREWSRGSGPQNKERDTDEQREIDKDKGAERASSWNRSSVLLSLGLLGNETQKGKPYSMENRVQKWLKFHSLRSVSLLFKLLVLNLVEFSSYFQSHLLYLLSQSFIFLGIKVNVTRATQKVEKPLFAQTILKLLAFINRTCD